MQNNSKYVLLLILLGIPVINANDPTQPDKPRGNTTSAPVAGFSSNDHRYIYTMLSPFNDRGIIIEELVIASKEILDATNLSESDPQKTQVKKIITLLFQQSDDATLDTAEYLPFLLFRNYDIATIRSSIKPGGVAEIYATYLQSITKANEQTLQKAHRTTLLRNFLLFLIDARHSDYQDFMQQALSQNFVSVRVGININPTIGERIVRKWTSSLTSLTFFQDTLFADLSDVEIKANGNFFERILGQANELAFIASLKDTINELNPNKFNAHNMAHLAANIKFLAVNAPKNASVTHRMIDIILYSGNHNQDLPHLESIKIEAFEYLRQHALLDSSAIKRLMPFANKEFPCYKANFKYCKANTIFFHATEQSDEMHRYTLGRLTTNDPLELRDAYEGLGRVRSKTSTHPYNPEQSLQIGKAFSHAWVYVALEGQRDFADYAVQYYSRDLASYFLDGPPRVFDLLFEMRLGKFSGGELMYVLDKNSQFNHTDLWKVIDVITHTYEKNLADPFLFWRYYQTISLLEKNGLRPPAEVFLKAVRRYLLSSSPISSLANCSEFIDLKSEVVHNIDNYLDLHFTKLAQERPELVRDLIREYIQKRSDFNFNFLKYLEPEDFSDERIIANLLKNIRTGNFQNPELLKGINRSIKSGQIPLNSPQMKDLAQSFRKAMQASDGKIYLEVSKEYPALKNALSNYARKYDKTTYLSILSIQFGRICAIFGHKKKPR